MTFICCLRAESLSRPSSHKPSPLGGVWPCPELLDCCYWNVHLFTDNQQFQFCRIWFKLVAPYQNPNSLQPITLSFFILEFYNCVEASFFLLARNSINHSSHTIPLRKTALGSVSSIHIQWEFLSGFKYIIISTIKYLQNVCPSLKSLQYFWLNISVKEEAFQVVLLNFFLIVLLAGSTESDYFLFFDSPSDIWRVLTHLITILLFFMLNISGPSNIHHSLCFPYFWLLLWLTGNLIYSSFSTDFLMLSNIGLICIVLWIILHRPMNKPFSSVTGLTTSSLYHFTTLSFFGSLSSICL